MDDPLYNMLPQSLTYMFRDDEWFWKVSLGALALVLIPFGVGYFLVIGYAVETVRRRLADEATLPEWNRLAALWFSGSCVGTALAVYSLGLCAAAGAVLRQANIPLIILLIMIVHSFVGPFVILRFLETASFRACFDLRSIASLARPNGLRSLGLTASSFGVFAFVLCFGWMALIIGWPILLFWGVLVSASFTAALALPYIQHGDAR